MWYDGLDATFSERMQQLVAASGGKLSIVSAYRSVEDQQYLWDQALAKYGSEDAARMWVAPPGSSNHNHGLAVDLGFETDDAMDWAHANASRFGLEFPMEWEPWHIEPIGVRDGTYAAGHSPDDGHNHAPGTADAYTTPPTGERAATDATRRMDLGYQLNSLNGILMGGSYDMLAGAGPVQSDAASPSMGITGGGTSGVA